MKRYRLNVHSKREMYEYQQRRRDTKRLITVHSKAADRDKMQTAGNTRTYRTTYSHTGTGSGQTHFNDYSI